MKRSVFFGFALSGLFFLVCCKRKDCIDIDAKNYNSTAKKDDGSFTYKGDAIVWFDQVKAQEFVDSNIVTVNFYVDGSKAGVLETVNFTGTPPSCFSPKGTTITKELQDNKSKIFLLEVREEDSTLISSHELMIHANRCTPFKLPN